MWKEGRLTAGDKQMDYITFGRGSRYLVMIQGLNTNGIRGAGAGLAWMYRAFAKEFTVYFFDRPVELPENITVRELAQDVALAMDAVGIRRAHVLGVSQGGMIAQYLAIDRPDLVDRLILAVTASRSLDSVTQAVETWIRLTEQGRIRALVEDMAERLYSADLQRKYRPFLPLLTLLQKPKDPRRFITLAGACLTCSSYEELEKITCPVFVIGAQEDRIVGSEASREIAEKLGCRLHLYEHMAHALWEEAGDFNKLVLDFLHSPSFP